LTCLSEKYSETLLFPRAESDFSTSSFNCIALYGKGILILASSNASGILIIA
jgi:hypothetical protein